METWVFFQYFLSSEKSSWASSQCYCLGPSCLGDIQGPGLGVAVAGNWLVHLQAGWCQVGPWRCPPLVFSTGRIEVGVVEGEASRRSTVIDISTLQHPFYISALYQDTCQDSSLLKCLCNLLHSLCPALALTPHGAHQLMALGPPSGMSLLLSTMVFSVQAGLSLSQRLPGVSLSVLP